MLCLCAIFSILCVNVIWHQSCIFCSSTTGNKQASKRAAKKTQHFYLGLSGIFGVSIVRRLKATYHPFSYMHHCDEVDWIDRSLFHAKNNNRKFSRFAFAHSQYQFAGACRRNSHWFGTSAHRSTDIFAQN